MTDLSQGYINQADKSSPLEIHPLTATIGAEIRGVKLSGDLSPDITKAIQAALVRHKVIFFRDQTELDDAKHEAFAALLGEPVAHPTVPVAEGSRYLLELDSKEGFAASSWHTDVTFTDAYPKASILRGITIPEAGGDTLWANAETAYDGLPESLRLLVDNLWAVHSNVYDYAAILASVPKDAAAARERVNQHQQVFASTVYETVHPVVRVHPVSGKRSLLLGHFFKSFVGYNPADSLRLFAILQDHITRPENVVRWRWRSGDVAIWDNQATQHRAVADFGLQRRTLRRATIAGDVPVGINGERSRIIRKEKAVEYQAA